MGLFQRTIPWVAATMEDGLRACDRVIASRGWTIEDAPVADERLTECEQRIGRSLPHDLKEFYRWWTPQKWRALVNPELSRKADHRPGGLMSMTGEMIEGDHPQNTIEDPIGIEPPDGISHFESPPLEKLFFRYWPESIKDGHASREWLELSAFMFGWTLFSDDLLCTTRTIAGCPTGSVVLTTQDETCVMICAHSLGEWLARLAACDGNEYFATPGDIDDLPRATRAMLRDDFERLNGRRI